MLTHKLKTWPAYFEAVYSGMKTFEIRKNDRNFQVGDILHLQEFDPKNDTYSGRYVRAGISYILDGGFGLEPGFVALALHILESGSEPVVPNPPPTPKYRKAEIELLLKGALSCADSGDLIKVKNRINAALSKLPNL